MGSFFFQGFLRGILTPRDIFLPPGRLKKWQVCDRGFSHKPPTGA